tara:strand:+ start:4496 stop:5659 length:1164 start_codon:yes stop_codon:yes gene_type:complete
MGKIKKAFNILFGSEVIGDISSKNSISTFHNNNSIGDIDITQNYTKSNKGYYLGVDGLYPQTLNHLYNTSPLQNNIINFKKLLTSGNGYSIQGNVKDGMEKVELNQMLTQFDKVIPQITMDLFIHNRFALKITWNEDNTRWLRVEALPVDSVRILKLNKKVIPLEYVYNFDWEQSTKTDTITYKAYNKNDIENKEQIYMHQEVSPGMKIYTYPSYQSATKWITLDGKMATYHTSNIENSLNPSMLIQFLEEPETEEKKQEILYGLNKTYSGENKAGRLMVTFSNGDDVKPIITQMEANKLDKTFLELTDTIQRQICYSHSIDPLLLGLKTPGSLGNSGDFEYTYNLFNNKTIIPAQKTLEDILNELIYENGMRIKIKFNDVNLEQNK